jgi:hypothetical protein
MEHGIADEAELRAYTRQGDQESAAQEIQLDRTAQAYEGGTLLPVGEEAEPITVPMPAFVVVVLIGVVLVLTLLLVG